MFIETKTEGEAPAVDAIGRILLDAAALQKHYGLCSDYWQSLDGRICPREAIRRASPDPTTWFEAEQRMRQYIGCRIDMWVIGRTLGEVTSAMRAAAAQ